MARQQLEKQVQLLLASCAEHEASEYVLTVALGPEQPGGQRLFGLGATHRTDALDAALSNEAALGFLATFQQVHGILPVGVLIIRVIEVERTAVVDAVMEKVDELLPLPPPTCIDDVCLWGTVLTRVSEG